jgi:hypothetical protein
MSGEPAMTTTIQMETFINKFVEELEEENAAIFAGAGLSRGAGFVDWKGLLRPIARELGLDIDKEHDLIAVAQYHCNERSGNRSELNRRLIHEFCQSHSITLNHRILARLPVRTFWTTNYDRLIEKALEEAGRTPDVKYTVRQLAFTKPKRDAVIYKMHGDVDHPDDAVLTKDDYEKYHVDHMPFITALSGDLVSKTFLFLGFSFTDPNLDYILSRIRITFDRSQRQHYCIFKRRARESNETEDAFRYACIKQELAVKDLNRFNVQTLFVDDYSEVTAILQEIECRFRQKTALISGSAHEYGAWEPAAAEGFMQDLSRTFIRNGYKIVSGFGLGVGSHVITGALQEIYEGQGEKLQDQLILRPFPQGPEAQKQWESYRQDMIAYAGIAIFVFGNRLHGEDVVPAGGVRREFEIAKASGLKLVPIGATGYMAEELWKEVTANFDSYYPHGNPTLKSAFDSLGDKSVDLRQHIDTVLKILDMLKGN